MDKSDKRDIMAAIIVQSVMIDKLKWLGEHARSGNKDRLEGLMDDALRDLVTGTYVLVDEMLEQGAEPDLLQSRIAFNKAATAAKAVAAAAGKPGAGSKPTEPAPRPDVTSRPVVNTPPKDVDMDGAKSDLSPLS